MAAELDSRLSLAFMRTHPQRAARVLELLPVDEAAELFAHAPARLGAVVLATMLPQAAASCLGALDDLRALQLLSPMGTQPTVAVLRCVPAQRRRALIDGLPTASALAATLLLGYADDTLGALADPDVISLPADTRAADALNRLRATPGEHGQVFVIDARRHLSGVVSMTVLLKAPASAKLATLLQRPQAMLAAHAPLHGSVAHPGWQRASWLPVAEPGNRLVGVLTHDALLRAVQRAMPIDPAPAADASMPQMFARSYWQGLSGLVEACLVWLPAVKPVAGAADGP
jgi:magnesium transporter